MHRDWYWAKHAVTAETGRNACILYIVFQAQHIRASSAVTVGTMTCEVLHMHACGKDHKATI